MYTVLHPPRHLLRQHRRQHPCRLRPIARRAVVSRPRRRAEHRAWSVHASSSSAPSFTSAHLAARPQPSRIKREGTFLRERPWESQQQARTNQRWPPCYERRVGGQRCCLRRCDTRSRLRRRHPASPRWLPTGCARRIICAMPPQRHRAAPGARPPASPLARNPRVPRSGWYGRRCSAPRVGGGGGGGGASSARFRGSRRADARAYRRLDRRGAVQPGGRWCADASHGADRSRI